MHKYAERYKSPEMIIRGVTYSKSKFVNLSPYAIRYDESGNYYFENWNHYFIGFDYKECVVLRNKNMKSIILFDDGCKPWDEQIHMDNYINKFQIELEKLKSKGVTNRQPGNLILLIEL